jgi:hypothetical protein
VLRRTGSRAKILRIHYAHATAAWLAEATHKAKDLHKRQQVLNGMVGRNLARVVNLQGQDLKRVRLITRFSLMNDGANWVREGARRRRRDDRNYVRESAARISPCDAR